MNLAEDLPWVMADRARIVQVLVNLLSNAARNSPESSPIRVSAALEGVHVAVSVIDRGRGIPAESLPTCSGSSPGLTPESSAWRHRPGPGHLQGHRGGHGGRIRAESDGPGLGARFTFSMPVLEQAGHVSSAASSPPMTRSSQRRIREQVRVLAVDDDPQGLRHVRDALLKSNYTPIVTPDPEEALRLVEDERPHLVLLDVVLPGTDGMELMREIVGRAEVPVIFLSAHGQEQLVASALDMGAADYLVKPFSRVELAARIRRPCAGGRCPSRQRPTRWAA